MLGFSVVTTEEQYARERELGKTVYLLSESDCREMDLKARALDTTKLTYADVKGTLVWHVNRARNIESGRSDVSFQNTYLGCDIYDVIDSIKADDIVIYTAITDASIQIAIKRVQK